MRVEYEKICRHGAGYSSAIPRASSRLTARLGRQVDERLVDPAQS